MRAPTSATILALALLGLAEAADAEPPAARAVVAAVEGSVSWRPAADAADRPALVGDRLFAGARIRTGERAYATLRWQNGGDLRLYPLSELVVAEEDGVMIEAGKVWAEFKQKLLAPFFFKTPGAAAVVRGTTLGVELRPAGETFVEVFEGRVEVRGLRGEGTRLLGPGESILVSPMGMFSPMQPLLPSPELRRSVLGAPQAVQAPPGGLEWLHGSRAAVRLDKARMAEHMKRAQVLKAEHAVTLQEAPPFVGRKEVAGRPVGRGVVVMTPAGPVVKEVELAPGPGPDGTFPAGPVGPVLQRGARVEGPCAFDRGFHAPPPGPGTPFGRPLPAPVPAVPASACTPPPAAGVR